MRSFSLRAGRWPLAFSVFALAAVAACSDDPVAPPPATLPTEASANALAPIYLTVTNTSGGTEVGSLRWAAAQVPATAYAHIRFDSTLAGDTIALDAELVLQGNVYIDALQNKGIVISGKNQHRVMRSVGPFLSLWNVTVTEGNAEYGSGVTGPRLFINYSNVQNNRGPGSAVYAELSLVAQNATVSGNVNGGPAVEYASGAQVELRHATIAYNSPGPGLGVRSFPSFTTKVLLHNTILSKNGSSLQNCNTWFGFVYGGTNISSDWSCGEVGIVVADPLLMPLANNGGPVLTHAIPHTSPAFNTAVGCPSYDARYVERHALKCDVGAFEFNDFTKVTITIDPNVKMDATGKALLKGTMTCTRADTFRLALELHQDQKVGGQIIDVHSAGDIPVSCSTSPQAWSASMGLMPGEAFKVGNARATANTIDTAEWITPAAVASAVRISRK